MLNVCLRVSMKTDRLLRHICQSLYTHTYIYIYIYTHPWSTSNHIYICIHIYLTLHTNAPKVRSVTSIRP